MRLWLLLAFCSIFIHAEIVKVDIECEEPSEKLVDHREMPLFMVKCVKSSVGPPLYHLAECAEPKLSKRLKVGETRIQKESGYSTVIGCLGRTNTREDYRWYFGPIECIIGDQKISAFPPNNVYFDKKAGKKFVCDADKMTIQPYHAAETTADPTDLFTILPVTQKMTTEIPLSTKKVTQEGKTTKTLEPVSTTKKSVEPTARTVPPKTTVQEQSTKKNTPTSQKTSTKKSESVTSTRKPIEPKAETATVNLVPEQKTTETPEATKKPEVKNFEETVKSTEKATSAPETKTTKRAEPVTVAEERKSTEPVTPPKTTSSCGTIANFPTSDQCWQKWNDTNSAGLCDARFGHLKDDNAVWESFTGASCECGSGEKGNGFFCYRPCGREQIMKLRCKDPLVCQMNATNEAYCGCPPGQKVFNHVKCIPEEDSCKTCKHDCHAASKCLPGGLDERQKFFSCGNCDKELGYSGSNGYCTDIDECRSENNCDEKATCINRIPILDKNMKYECICNKGYQGEGTKCSPCRDINECLTPNVCGPHAECINTDGSYSCKCEPGYITGPSGLCIDENECVTVQYPCRPNSKCQNTNGSYNCPCDEGYLGDGKPASSQGCQLDQEICTKCDDKTTDCVINEKGTAYECRCKKNYLPVDAISCKPKTYCHQRDKVECAPVGKADCHDAPDGSNYTCTCAAGFTGDGKSCREINICLREKPCTYVPGTYCKADDKSQYDTFGCPCLDNHVRQIADQMNTTGQCYSVLDFMANNCSVCTEREECYQLKNSPLKSCKCKDGYKHMADGRCHNINECQTKEDDCDEYRATCIDKDPVVDHSKYECRCKRGFDGTGQKDSCANVNECLTGDSITADPVCTGEGELCEDTIGSYVCNCQTGFTRRENHCEDVNECTMNIHRCPAFTKCINKAPGYICECLTGYSPKYFDNKTLASCENINECKESKLNSCDNEREECIDVPGSYYCTCKQGFAKINQHCEDIDECQNEHDNKCSLVSTTCNNTFGGYYCACKPGFEVDKSGLAGSNLTCKDIDECQISSHECHANSYCKNTKGSYQCHCDEGFVESPNSPKKTITPYCIREKKCEKDRTLCIPGVCVDIEDEPYYRCDCIVGTINYNNTACIDSKYCNAYEKDFVCPQHATCKGKGICECVQGYRWQDLAVPFTIEDIRTKRSCKPIDFCSTYNNCGDMKCRNTKPGEGECYCPEGYKKEGTKCIDINECADPKVCPTNTTCHNTEGSYDCHCPTGYIHLDGPKTKPVCENVNECLHKLDNCTSYKNSHCEDSPGAFVCACNNGYKRDQLGNYGDYRDCVDDDECERKDELCDKVAKCTNTIGSYYCSCPTGYRGDGDKGLPCMDIDECDQLTHNCSTPSERCVNEPGTFHCECNKGYEKIDGKCPNVNECLKKLHNCSEIETCVDTPGSFYCDCDKGFYRPKANEQCIDKNECAIPGNCPSTVGDICKNTIGSFECLCNPGFEKPKHCRQNPTECPCNDIDECSKGRADGSNFCGKNTNCTNLIGSAECICKTNYAGDAYSKDGCKLVDVCKKDPNPCARFENTICKAKGEAEFECPCKADNYVRVGLNSLNCREIICGGTEDLKDPFCKNGVCRETLNRDTKQYEALCICKDNEIAVNTTKPGKKECVPADVCKCENKPVPCLGSPVCSDPSKMTCTPQHEKTDCTCLNYFKFNEKTKKCEEQNPCVPFPCPVNATCSSLKDNQGFNMTFRCTCPLGQKLETVGGIQKCTRNDADCEKCKFVPNSKCTPKENPYAVCECDDDYITGIDGSCVLDDACKRWAKHNPKSKRCGENAIPVADETNTKCVCQCTNRGFKHINETDCEDRNECLENVNPCSKNGTHPECVNTFGSFYCGCGIVDKNMELKNGTCQPINKCIDTTCDASTTICEQFTGACECKAGFERLDEKTCVNIDECAKKTYDCPKDSSCSDRTPGYDCICNTGYEPINLTAADPKPHHHKGFKCMDINECDKPNVCPKDISKCVNEPGSYHCECFPPAYNVGKYYCAFNSTRDCSCSPDAHCIQLQSGSLQKTHNCSCNAGYEGNGETCTDVNECPKACAENAKCTNLPGSYNCECLEPLQGSGLAGQNCIRIPHCSPNPCPTGSQCSLLDVLTENKWFTCKCPVGFEYNAKNNTCDNINECELCKEYKHCPCPKDAVKCIDTQGSYTCECGGGFEYNTKDNTCDDIVECDRGTTNEKCLSSMGTCVNEIGSWNCTCLDGYENKKGNKQECQEIIICGTEKDPCFKNTTDCISTGPGKYSCECKSGYTKDIMDSRMCEDIDEPRIGTCNCSILTETCINIPGSYRCDCLAKYRRNDATGVCELAEKCPNECPELASCYLDRNDKPVCKCPYNYEMNPNNKTCDPRPCLGQEAYCPRNAQCQLVQIRNDTISQKGVTALNQAGSYQCVCDYPLVYDTTAGTCTVPKNICEYAKCRENEVCKTTDTLPFFACSCKPGEVCKNTTQECNPEMCGRNSECILIRNTPVCKCKPGFVGLGTATSDCKPIKKCEEKSCSVFASCQNDVCVCDSHYHGNGTTCYDKNECTEKKADGSAMHNCHAQADCFNTQGGFICKCKTGYSGTGQTCDDIDECEKNLHNCHAETTNCKNTPGSYVCKCKDGFEAISGVDNKCQDINECDKKIDKCDNATSKCFNQIPGYICDCKAGYRTSPGSNKICLNVDECYEKLHDCHINANCKDLTPALSNGTKYMCICKEGYTGNGTTCNPIDQCAINYGGCDTKTTTCQMLWDVPEAKCNCMPGFEKENPRDKTCRNKNECINGEAVFNKDTTECIDKIGSYELKCKAGYVNKHPQANATNSQCEDLDECAMDAAYAEALKIVEENQKTQKYNNEQLINVLPAPKDNSSGYAVCYNYAKAGVGFGASTAVMLPMCKNEKPAYTFARTRPLPDMPSVIIRGYSCDCGGDARKELAGNNYKCEDPQCNCEEMLGAHSTCKEKKCDCIHPYILKYDQKLGRSLCDLTECSEPVAYPQKIVESGKTNLILCEKGKFRAIDGFKIVRKNVTNEIIDIIDINECEVDPASCCKNEKTCQHDLCVKCVNTHGSFRCALARNESIDCSKGCVDVNTCKCSSIVCPVQDAWFYNCERKCNASSHPSLDKPEFNKKLCSRFVDDSGLQYKTLSSLRDLYIEICKFNDDNNNRYACMFSGNDNDLTKSPMFNYWGECQDGANAAKVTCPDGKPGKERVQKDQQLFTPIISRVVCTPAPEDWPLKRKIVNGAQVVEQSIVVGAAKGIEAYPSNGEPWCYDKLSKLWFKEGNFFALPNGEINDFY